MGCLRGSNGGKPCSPMDMKGIPGMPMAGMAAKATSAKPAQRNVPLPKPMAKRVKAATSRRPGVNDVDADEM